MHIEVLLSAFFVGFKHNPESQKMVLNMSRIQSKITWHTKNQKNLDPYRER